LTGPLAQTSVYGRRFLRAKITSKTDTTQCTRRPPKVLTFRALFAIDSPAACLACSAATALATASACLPRSRATAFATARACLACSSATALATAAFLAAISASIASRTAASRLASSPARAFATAVATAFSWSLSNAAARYFRFRGTVGGGARGSSDRGVDGGEKRKSRGLWRPGTQPVLEQCAKIVGRDAAIDVRIERASCPAIPTTALVTHRIYATRVVDCCALCELLRALPGEHEECFENLASSELSSAMITTTVAAERTKAWFPPLL